MQIASTYSFLYKKKKECTSYLCRFQTPFCVKSEYIWVILNISPNVKISARNDLGLRTELYLSSWISALV